MLPPPVQSEDQLRTNLNKAEEEFRVKRLEEDPALYHQFYDDFEGHIADLLELTVDLTRLKENAVEVITTPRMLAVARYFCGPPISWDDLRVIAQMEGIAKKDLPNDEQAIERLIGVILTTLDKRRFPWLSDGREADESERATSISGTAALMASQKLQTLRRTKAKEDQEEIVKLALIDAGFNKVPNRHVQTYPDAPAPGSFCCESRLGKRKADFIVTLLDSRLMPIECKVSNSSTNSVKRLNNDAAVKAVRWIEGFGDEQVVPAAVLSGVYKLHNLVDAQEKRLSIFWEHDIAGMVAWIKAATPPVRRRNPTTM